MAKRNKKLVRASVKELNDADYLDKLDAESAEWYNKFIAGYYDAATNPELSTKENQDNYSRKNAVRRDIWNQKQPRRSTKSPQEIESVYWENGVKITRYKAVKPDSGPSIRPKPSTAAFRFPEIFTDPTEATQDLADLIKLDSMVEGDEQ